MARAQVVVSIRQSDHRPPPLLLLSSFSHPLPPPWFNLPNLVCFPIANTAAAGTDSDIMGDSGATFPDYVDQDLFTQLWTVTDDGSFFINMFKDWCSNVATKVPIANQQLYGRPG